MARTKIGILFGGQSEEHPISIKSAQEVAKSLDPEKYEPYYVGIAKDGAWKLCDAPGPDWEAGNTRPAVLSPDASVRGLQILEEDGYRTVELDVVFPVLHGKMGEDGAMQGLLELSGLPYVGCDVQSSALCMDKSLAYVVTKAAGIPTPKFWIVTPSQGIDADQLDYPVFVKPARSGSSFGVSKVTSKEELSEALAVARQYDSKVLIEEAVVASEVGCAVLGNGTDLFVGVPDRIALSHGFFRIHQEEKPEEGSENSTFVVPADISEALTKLAQETAKAIYSALGCRGLARVDMFLTEGGDFILNEVNTLPGMTSYSRYPRMMKAAGLSLGDVIDRLVSAALAVKSDAN